MYVCMNVCNVTLRTITSGTTTTIARSYSINIHKNTIHIRIYICDVYMYVFWFDMADDMVWYGMGASR